MRSRPIGRDAGGAGGAAFGWQGFDGSCAAAGVPSASSCGQGREWARDGSVASSVVQVESDPGKGETLGRGKAKAQWGLAGGQGTNLH